MEQPDVLRMFQPKDACRDTDRPDYIIEVKTDTLSLSFRLYAPWNVFAAFETHLTESMSASSQRRREFSIGVQIQRTWFA